ncbi:NAD(P)-dependent oxidoreductase [Echinicola pacifica]|uniref:dTDP-4-dehydrorhamnose reductase n=1 Tax=Echinicola pacifica TaxID=346377 RepID=A0A918UWH2_9BACT|nr:dTDP-4-dehydrorhamnose reductase [Echinicola pacifica]GGZ37932.1 NAD(P)-dependent oxidoreductase [Echinicola pacifica]
MLNILVIGSNGQLGAEIRSLSHGYPFQFLFTTRKELDISSLENINQYLNAKKVDVIINCAAYTAVDRAETEEEQANLVNHLAVQSIAKAAQSFDIKLIHVSTDYVFEGIAYQPYLEDALTNPKNIYGKSKAAGERAMCNINPDNSLIIRTSWVYSSFGSNFVKTMLKLGRKNDQLKVIDDQIGSPTYARDLAKAILDILPNLNHTGVEIYHYTNEGVCTWYDFAKSIMEFGDIDCNVLPQLTENYPTPAKRPHFSVMSKYKIKEKFNIEIPYWRDALKECILLLKNEDSA